jgi:hypothetical protein
LIILLIFHLEFSTTPTFLSIVQKGKFSAATQFLVKELNKVDLPEFGKPTIPTDKE